MQDCEFVKQVNTIDKQLYWNANQLVTYYKTMQDRHTTKKYHGLLLAADAIHTLRNLPSQLKSGDTVSAQLYNATVTFDAFAT